MTAETRETTFGQELMAYIFEAHAVVPAAERRVSHWVMNLEWFLEVRRMAADRAGYWFWEPSFTFAGPEFLMGLPIEVREDGGAPHLERNASDG